MRLPVTNTELMFGRRDAASLFFSQEVVVRLRQKLNADKTAKQSVEQDLTADANRVKLKTRELQEQLSRAQTAARKQLTDLTVQSANSAKKLQAVISQVRHVPSALPPLAPELALTLLLAVWPRRARRSCTWPTCVTNWSAGRTSL